MLIRKTSINNSRLMKSAHLFSLWELWDTAEQCGGMFGRSVSVLPDENRMRARAYFQRAKFKNFTLQEKNFLWKKSVVNWFDLIEWEFFWPVKPTACLQWNGLPTGRWRNLSKLNYTSHIIVGPVLGGLLRLRSKEGWADISISSCRLVAVAVLVVDYQ